MFESSLAVRHCLALRSRVWGLMQELISRVMRGAGDAADRQCGRDNVTDHFTVTTLAREE